MQDIIVVNNRSVVVFSFVDGPKVRKEENIAQQARKSPEELLRVCLWLENHGYRDEASALLERYV